MALQVAWALLLQAPLALLLQVALALLLLRPPFELQQVEASEVHSGQSSQGLALEPLALA